MKLVQKAFFPPCDSCQLSFIFYVNYSIMPKPLLNLRIYNFMTFIDKRNRNGNLVSNLVLPLFWLFWFHE